MAEYIEREAYLDRLEEVKSVLVLNENDSFDDGVRIGIERAMSEAETIPAADVRPVVRGKWIDRDDDYYGWNMWACSACGEEFVLTEGTPDMNDYHFCPNCGADVREPPKEE